MGHAELAAPIFLGIVDVDADDLVGAGHPGALDDVEPDAAEAEHDDVGARRDLGGVDDGADAGRDAAADVAALVERGVLADLRHRDLRQHREIREGRAAHIVIDRLALIGEAAGAVRHHALALRGADRRAQIGLLAQAAFALAAFGRVERDHVVAGFHRCHALADFTDDACALVAEDGGENSLAVEAVERISVGVTDPRRLDLDQHFAGLRPVEIDFDDLERLLGFECDSSTRLHSRLHLHFAIPRKCFAALRKRLVRIISSPCRNFPPGCRHPACLPSWGDERARPRHWRGRADRCRCRPCSRRRSGYRRAPASRSPAPC